ncbi:MAG: hypothetical protein EBY24_18540, partial [Betaproteobacteria bacterium]|nr:hypothetical protein [Betaproteobacteria bacterium]
LAGAEEVLLRMAPDLARDATLLRMDGDPDLGARYAIECSLAYKGVWVRVGRNVTNAAPPASWAAADAWFDHALQQIGDGLAWRRWRTGRDCRRQADCRQHRAQNCLSSH